MTWFYRPRFDSVSSDDHFWPGSYLHSILISIIHIKKGYNCLPLALKSVQFCSNMRSALDLNSVYPLG